MTQVEIANLALSKVGDKRLTAVDTTTVQGQAVTDLWGPVRDSLLRRHRWNFAKKRVAIDPVWVVPDSVSDSSGLVNIESTGHGLTTGARVTTKDTETSNGTFIITRVDDDNFTLNSSTWSDDMAAGSYHVAPGFGYAYQYPMPADCLRALEVNGIEADTGADADWVIEGRAIFTDETQVLLHYIFQETDTANWDAQFVDVFAMKLAIELASRLADSITKRQQLQEEVERIQLPDALFSDAVEPRPRIIRQDRNSRVVSARIYGA